jgi:hypothetical protein
MTTGKTQLDAYRAVIAQDFMAGLCYHGRTKDGRFVFGSAEFEKEGRIVHLAFTVDATTLDVNPLYGKRYDAWIRDTVDDPSLGRKRGDDK